MSNESRRLLAETRELLGLIEGRRITNDYLLRQSLRKFKRILRLNLQRRGYTSEQLSTMQREAVQRHTPRSAEPSRRFDDIESYPIPVVDD